jgi:hypothetical protein
MDKRSHTEKLALDIEMLTGSSWTREQRSAVSDLIRQYRFEQVSGVLVGISKMVKDSGDTELSEKIIMGKF